MGQYVHVTDGGGWQYGDLEHADLGLGPSDCDDPGTAVLVGAVFGGATLGGLGALLGWPIRTDRWVEVPLDRLRVGATSQPSGGSALGLSL